MSEIQYPDDCIKVLDKGFVRLVDVMGDDSSIVQAARVSYGKGTKKVSEDRGLIRYLMRHQHTTPFEMVEFKFHCRMPIFVARQWIRHRTANVNEYSGRYSEMPNMFYQIKPDRMVKQSQANRQGGGEELIEHPKAYSSFISNDQRNSHSRYKNLLGTGLSRELARINLPLSQYTEWYWKNDLNNIFHFLKLRLDAHAQYEIRVYAEAMARYVKEKAPIAWEAFEEYQLRGMALGSKELNILCYMIKNRYNNLDKVEILMENLIPSKREREEFTKKFQKILDKISGMKCE